MSWFNRGNKKQQSKQQQFKQQQIERQDEAQVELLKDEVDSLFDIFEGVLNYLKSNNVQQSGLLSYNDSAVAGLKLFGASCKDEDSDRRTLQIAHHHFTAKRQNMDPADRRIVKSWLDYAEAGLLGKKLKKLKISKITIDAAHEYMKQGGLQTFMDSFTGAEHQSHQIVQNAQQNKDQLRQQHSRAAQQNQQSYQQRQGMVTSPDQNDMYQVAGGAQNIKFGSSLYHPSSKYYNQRPKDDQENKQQSGSMDVDGGSSQSSSGAVWINQKDYPYKNAYVKKAPPQTLKRYGKTVQIQYPYPCEIKEFLAAQQVGVVYARPNDDLRVKLSLSNIERDPKKVSELEQAFMSHSNQGLGYDSIKQQSSQGYQ